jgi:hypothetical protein
VSLKKLVILHREEGTYPDIINTHIIFFSNTSFQTNVFRFTFNTQLASFTTNSGFLISKILLSHFYLALVWLRGLKIMNEDKVFTPIFNEVESGTMIERGM